MPTRHIAERILEVDGDGYLVDPCFWTPRIADSLAREAGIKELTQKHWTVISFCREDSLTTGETPSLSRIASRSGISMRELHELFPRQPGRLTALIAGLSGPAETL